MTSITTLPAISATRNTNTLRQPEPLHLADTAYDLDDQPSSDLESEVELPSLPPADTGRAAWLVLAGCSIIQAPVWGFPLSFGVFQDYYMGLDSLKGDQSSIANTGTSASGVLYLSSPVTFALLTRYPHLRRWCGPLGLALTITGFLASSFVDSVGGLVATQGVLASIGSGLLYSPTTLYLDEWFIQKKGLAIGAMLAGKSLAGVILPFAAEAMLHRFGLHVTMYAWSVVILLLTAPLLYFLKPRIPLSASTAPRKMSLSFFTLPSFWTLQTGNILQSLGYFLPSAYLGSYASTIGLNPRIGTLMIALFNAASIPGSLVMGMLNDHFEVSNVILLSSLGSTFTVFIFWGLAGQAALLAIFAILYGFFAGGYSATWSGSMTQMKKERPALDTGLAFGLLAGVRGVGNVISGPLSSALVRQGLVSHARFGYETKYEWLIVFTGMTALLGGWSWGWKESKKLIHH